MLFEDRDLDAVLLADGCSRPPGMAQGDDQEVVGFILVVVHDGDGNRL